jgi:chromate transporter
LRPLGSLALLFLKLGTLAFGGPAAHIAMMREEVVVRRQWLADAEFLDLLAASNLIPGPSSTELAIHLGLRLGGWRGLVLAGVCFILPAALLVTAIASLYQRFHMLPQAEGILFGVKPVVVAIVLHALRSLAQASLRSLPSMVIAAAAFAMAAFGLNELAVLLVCGGAASLLKVRRPLSVIPLWGAGTASVVPVSLWGLFAIFLKVCATVFGSGYVLLAFLQSDLVQRLHWLSNKQLLDAVAVGQVTPGPVFTTATFIGYLLAGIPGAVIATIGIFLPGFLLVAVSGPLIPRLRASPPAAAFLDGVTAGSLSLIAWVLLLMGRTALIDPISIGIALVSFLALSRFSINPSYLVLAGALLGLFAG